MWIRKGKQYRSSNNVVMLNDATTACNTTESVEFLMFFMYSYVFMLGSRVSSHLPKTCQ